MKISDSAVINHQGMAAQQVKGKNRPLAGRLAAAADVRNAAIADGGRWWANHADQHQAVV